MKLKLFVKAIVYSQAPGSCGRVAVNLVDNHDSPGPAGLEHLLKGSHVRLVLRVRCILMLIDGNAVDPDPGTLRGVGQEGIDGPEELGEGALPRVRDEVGRDPEICRVDVLGAVGQAPVPRHVPALDPAVDELLCSQVLKGKDRRKGDLAIRGYPLLTEEAARVELADHDL